MGEPAHSMDMNEECCNDITTFCEPEACTVLLQGKCMETIYLLDRQYHPTFNGTLLHVSWHPVGHPLPDHEEHRRCLLSPKCESKLCQVQDPNVPNCDPEIIPHICPASTTATTPLMGYPTTPYVHQSVTTAGPIQSAEGAQMGKPLAPIPPIQPPKHQPHPSVIAPVLPQGFLPIPVQHGNRHFFPPIIPVGSSYPGNSQMGQHSPGNVLQIHSAGIVHHPPVPSIPPGSDNAPVQANPLINAQGNPSNPANGDRGIPKPSGNENVNPGSQPTDQNSRTLNQIPASNANSNPSAGEGTNVEPAANPENSLPMIPQQPVHANHEPQEPQQGDMASKYPQPGLHKLPSPVNQEPPQPGVQELTPNPPQAGYRPTTETAKPQRNRGKSNPQAIPISRPRNTIERGTTSVKPPPVTVRGTATQKPDSSLSVNEFGAGRQDGFIQGQEPFFTLHRAGNISRDTAPPDISTQAGPIGNAPNGWEKLDEKILAGGIVGGALLALLMVCLTVCCVKRRKDGKSSGASTTSSHRGLHLQYSGFPLDSDMLNDPVYKSSMKSVNGPPPVPYRPPAPHISHIPSFREPTNNFVGGGGICFGEEQSESNDYEELPCDVEPSAREAYEELVEGQKLPTSRSSSNVSSLSKSQHHKLRSVPTLYDVNRKRMPPVVKRNSSASTLKSNSMRNSTRPLPARPSDSLPRTLESGPREVYEPLGLETPHGYEVPVTLGSASNLAMLGILNYPHPTSTYDIGTLVSHGSGQSVGVPSDRSSAGSSFQIPQPDYFVLERQDEFTAVPTVSHGDYRPASRRQSLTYTPDSENSYAEVGHEYLDLERSGGGWQGHYLPSDIQL